MQDTAHVTAEEATFYLEAANYVLADALAAHRADAAWSTQQAAPRPGTNAGTSAGTRAAAGTNASTTAPGAAARAAGTSAATTALYPNLISFSTTALPEDPAPALEPIPAPEPIPASERIPAPAALEPVPALEPIPAPAAPEPIPAPVPEVTRAPKTKSRRALVAS